MRPRSIDVDDERARLESELRAAARAAHGSWSRVSTSEQADLLTAYRGERRRILRRLRELRRIERYRAATDGLRRIHERAKEAAAQ